MKDIVMCRHCGIALADCEYHRPTPPAPAAPSRNLPCLTVGAVYDGDTVGSEKTIRAIEKAIEADLLAVLRTTPKVPWTHDGVALLTQVLKDSINRHVPKPPPWKFNWLIENGQSLGPRRL